MKALVGRTVGLSKESSGQEPGFARVSAGEAFELGQGPGTLYGECWSLSCREGISHMVQTDLSNEGHWYPPPPTVFHPSLCSEG